MLKNIFFLLFVLNFAFCDIFTASKSEKKEEQKSIDLKDARDAVNEIVGIGLALNDLSRILQFLYLMFKEDIIIAEKKTILRKAQSYFRTKSAEDTFKAMFDDMHWGNVLGNYEYYTDSVKDIRENLVKINDFFIDKYENNESLALKIKYIFLSFQFYRKLNHNSFTIIYVLLRQYLKDRNPKLLTIKYGYDKGETLPCLQELLTRYFGL